MPLATTRKKLGQAFAVTLSLAIVSFFAGCKIDGSINKAADAVRDASTNIREGLKEGGAALDPAGIKKLLDENEALRQDLVNLQVKTSSFGPSVGLINLSNERLLLRVSEYRGDFVVNSWVDDKTNWILHDRTYNSSNAARIANGTPLGVNMEAAFQAYCRDTHTSCDAIRSAENVWGAQNYLYNNIVVPQFSSLVAASVEAENKRSIDLQHQISPGKHWLSIEVTPIAKGAGGNDWFIRWQLVQVFANGSEQILKEADSSSNLAALVDHSLGKPLDPVIVGVEAVP